MDTTIRFPDNPMPVSLNALKEYDAYPAGTFIAQPKKDGFRRTIWRIDGKWHYNAKHTTGPHSQPLPPLLIEKFEHSLSSLNADVCLDCEWMGPRHKNKEHRLVLFDILMLQGNWLGGIPFETRVAMLETFFMDLNGWWGLELLGHRKNPGLMDYFAEQLQDPESEGLVVRRADSGLIGGLNACADNPKWVKVKMKEVRK